MKNFKINLRKRSVFKQGAAFVVTLPIEWVRSRKIKQGSIIQPVLQKNGNLLLALEKLEDE
jgi:hypothetical protein